MEDHAEVAEMVAAARFVWHKTRQRAARQCSSEPRDGDIMEMMAAMCGEPTPIFAHGVPDWTLVSSNPADFESAVRAQPVSYLEALYCHVLPATSTLKRDLDQLCRRLGRNPRIRHFLLEAEAVYKQWAKEPDWDIFLCPFPPALDREASDLLGVLSDDLVAWSLPREAQIEEAFRTYVLNHPPTGWLGYLCGSSEELPEFKVRRKAPAIHTLLPRTACLQIHRALGEYRTAIEREISTKEKHPIIERCGSAVSEILDRYLPALRQVGVTSADVLTDILNFDVCKSSAELMGIPPGDKRRSRAV